jgi:hypothetical protein
MGAAKQWGTFDDGSMTVIPAMALTKMSFDADNGSPGRLSLSEGLGLPHQALEK